MSSISSSDNSALRFVAAPAVAAAVDAKKDDATTSPAGVVECTVYAAPNIAVTKYWGCREKDKLNLPVNDSISLTLSTNKLRSKTSVILTDKVADDMLWLNGVQEDLKANPRMVNVFQRLRASAPPEKAKLKAVIVSNNNFPTAAGMASSASGYCALACGLAKVFEYKGDVSVLARIGSGSACRSVYGGFVEWRMGDKDDVTSGENSIAVQHKPHTHWPEMNILVAVVKEAKKDVSSSKGMQLSLKTSPMMKERVETVVPQRMEIFRKAIAERDFATFAKTAMADSRDLQEVCRTTEPTIKYATEHSFSIMRFIEKLNEVAGKPIAAYTYDAGANAFLFALDENVVLLTAALLHHYPCEDGNCVFENEELLKKARAFALEDKYKGLLPADDTEKGKPLQNLFHSPVGSGPVFKSGQDESLVDFATLQPKKDWKP